MLATLLLPYKLLFSCTEILFYLFLKCYAHTKNNTIAIIKSWSINKRVRPLARSSDTLTIRTETDVLGIKDTVLKSTTTKRGQIVFMLDGFKKEAIQRIHGMMKVRKVRDHVRKMYVNEDGAIHFLPRVGKKDDLTIDEIRALLHKKVIEAIDFVYSQVLQPRKKRRPRNQACVKRSLKHHRASVVPLR